MRCCKLCPSYVDLLLGAAIFYHRLYRISFRIMNVHLGKPFVRAAVVATITAIDWLSFDWNGHLGGK